MSELSIWGILQTKSSPVSISFLPAYQPHHLMFSLLPFSCHFSLKLAQILSTEENFLLCFRQFVSSSAEFMAVRVCFCVDGQVYFFNAKLLPSLDDLCHLISSLQIVLFVQKLLVHQEMPWAETYLLNQPYIIDQSRSAVEGRQPECSNSYQPANFTDYFPVYG